MRKCDHCGQPAEYYGDGWAECPVCYHEGAKEYLKQFRLPRWVLVLRFLGWFAGIAFASYLLILFIKFCWTHS